MKKYIALLICILPLLAACNDYLDIKPKGYTIPEYYEDYRRLMNDAQVMGKASESYPCLITDDAQFPPEGFPVSLDEQNENVKNLYRFLCCMPHKNLYVA